MHSVVAAESARFVAVVIPEMVDLVPIANLQEMSSVDF